MSEKYLIDANSLIRPARAYYPFDFAPSFWRQLHPKITLDKIAILDKVHAELLQGTDALAEWARNLPDSCVMPTNDGQITMVYTEILTYIQQSKCYNDAALRLWSQFDIADPWLIAAAKAYGYTILTFEQSAGIITTKSRNPKIPDIARHFHVPCASLFDMMRQETFRL